MSNGMPGRSPWSWLGVQPEEVAPAAWAFLYFFALLTGYYVLRPVRDALGAAGQLQWLFTGTFVCMLLLTPVYGGIVARYPRRVFLPAVYGFFIACLLTFFALFQLFPHAFWLTATFFIWVAVFNLFAVSVFWSFMSDIFEQAQAKRLYGPIAAGGTVGGFVGPTITGLAVQTVGVANLFLISAGLLGLALIAILRLVPWARQMEQRRGAADGDVAIGGSSVAGAKLVARSPFLFAMVLLMYFGVGVGTLLYNEQAAITRELFTDAAARTAYYARIDFAINSLSLVLQAAITRALLTRYGVKPLLLIPAAAMIIGFSALTGSPTPLLLAGVQVVTRAGNFGMIQPGRESLFTRVDRESRYKAKNFIDTVVYRAGDLTFVWLHTALVAVGVGHSGIAALGACVAAVFALASWRVIATQPKVEAAPPGAPVP